MGRNLGPLNIKDSYEGLVQISGSQLTDGSGSLIPSLDVSASFATTANTATSASHALNADNAISSSYAVTASFALNAGASTLQEVLDNSNTATGVDIILTGSYQRASGSFSGNVIDNITDTYTGTDKINHVVTLTQAEYNALTPSSDTFYVITDAAATMITGSVTDATLTFTKDDATTFPLTVNNVANAVTAQTASFLPAGTNLNINSITASFASFTSASIGSLRTVTGSAVIIGDEFIILNADTPTARYAGLVVYDSGSGTPATASFEWDGLSDNWIVVEESGNSAVVLTGPTGSKGSEVEPTVDTLQKGGGHHQLIDSNVTDDGSTTKVSNRFRTGASTAAGAYAAAVGGQGTQANNTHAAVIGGFNNNASGIQSFIAGGGLSSVTQQRGAVIGGYTHNVAAEDSVIIGGYDSDVLATHERSVILGGNALATTKADEVVVPHLTISGSTIATDISASGYVSASSFIGDGSQLTGISSDPFPYTGSAEITGSLVVSGSIITGLNNTVGNTTATNAIIGGTGLTGGASIDNSLLMGGLNNTIAYGDESVIIGGESNLTEQNRVAIIGGFSHKVTTGEGGIFVGNNNEVRQPKGVILGGNDNTISNYNGNSSAILSGGSNQAKGNQYAAIIAGQSNSLLTSGSENTGPVSGSAIVGGISNTIVDGQVSAIIGGENHYMDGVDKSVIIGGSNISASVDSTAYVPHLNVSGSLTDSDGNIGTVGQVLTSNGTDKVQWDTAAGGAAFPYTGSAEITGSLGVTGSILQEGSNSIVAGSTPRVVILASSGSSLTTTQPDNMAIIASKACSINSTNTNTYAGGIFGAQNSTFGTGETRSSVILGGGSNTMNGKLCAIVAAENSSVGAYSNFLGGGFSQQINGDKSAIIGGINGRVNGGTNNGVVGGNGNNVNGSQNGILAGSYHNIPTGVSDSAIVGGYNSDADHDRSVVIGGNALATTKADEVVVPSLDINGTVVQSVQALTITSNTASLDASTGQMFTLGLQNAADTHLELSNQVAGQTFSLKITNNATSAGTITFDSQFDFEGGTPFTATAATNAVDILTFTTFDGSNVQCVGSKNFS